jgi:hypothetical protein
MYRPRQQRAQFSKEGLKVNGAGHQILKGLKLGRTRRPYQGLHGAFVVTYHMAGLQ